MTAVMTAIIGAQIECCMSSGADEYSGRGKKILATAFFIDLILFVGFLVAGSLGAMGKLPHANRILGYGLLGGAGALLLPYMSLLAILTKCFKDWYLFKG